MKTFKCYVYTTGLNSKVVWSPEREPWESEYKSKEDWYKAIKKWNKTFKKVPNAHWNNKSGLIIVKGNILNTFEDNWEVLNWGNKCVATLIKGKIKILCHEFGSGWTCGYGVFGKTPEEAIRFYKEYVEWLKVRKPGDYPPSRN